MIPLNALSAQWPMINALLDEALSLPVLERASWLESLVGERAEFKHTLSELLAAHAGIETGDFMGTLPKLANLGRVDAVDAEPVAGDTVGPYRLISELGRGGMGTVWLADRADAQLKRLVALKLPRLAWGAGLTERLARERDILATLAHPNIARLYDAGVDQRGRPYLAMEYVEGQCIDVYSRDRQLPLRERLALLLQVCDAVAHAHARLVVHRDLKPGNILVTAEGQVRLLDFGIAKLMEGDKTAETSLTQQSGRALTLDYASPEQIHGEPLGTASDVYSLAVVAYELLAGTRPYKLKRGSAVELEEAIASADPPRASDAAAEPALKKALRGDLDAILNKALRKDPAQRYPTMVAFAEDIERHLNQQPVLAQPDTFAYRARKFVLRHRLETGIAAALAIALLGGAYAQVAVTVALAAGSGVALWQARAARGQARLARKQAARAEEAKKFVLSFFEAADVDRGGSRQTTAVDLLKQARDRLDAAPITDHATRVELLTTIGSGLHGLGELQQAAPLLAEATRLAEANLTDNDRITTDAQIAYGQVLGVMGDWKGAERQFDAAERSSRHSGDMARLSAALRGKASVLADEVQYDRAIELGWEAVRAAESQSPPIDKRAVIACYLSVAAQLHIAQRAGAIAPAQRAYTLARDLYGDRPTAQLLEAQMRYANALGLEGDTTNAVQAMKEVLQRQADVFGADHPEVARGLMSLGQTSLKLGDPVSAIESMRESVRIWVLHSDGKSTTEVAGSRINLGAALANAHRWDEALAQWSEANSLYCALYGADNEAARVARSGMALALTKLGRLDESDVLYAALLARPFSSAIEEVFINGRLGLLRSAQGRHDEALVLLQGAPEFFADAPKGRLRGLALADVGAALVAGGRDAEALEQLREARAILLESQPNGSPDLADIALDIARALLALGRAGEAIEATEEATAFWTRLDPASRSAGVALLWHTRALNAAGNKPQAAEALHRASAILEAAALPTERELLEQTQREIDASPQQARR